MKKTAITACILFTLFLSAGAQNAPQPAGEINKFIEGVRKDAAYERSEFNFGSAEQLILQAIMMFDSQSAALQTEYEGLKAELYYDLTRYLAMQGKKEEAVEAFRRAVDYGWTDHARAKADPDLKNIRWEKGYREVMKAIRPAR